MTIVPLCGGRGETHNTKSANFLRLNPREDERSVSPTKPKRIGKRRINGHITRSVGNVVEIAAVTGMIEVNRGRSYLVTYGERADSAFDGPSRAQKMSNHGFGRTHRHLSIGTKHCLDGLRFGYVALGRRRPMRINVLDALGIHVGIR